MLVGIMFAYNAGSRLSQPCADRCVHPRMAWLVPAFQGKGSVEVVAALLRAGAARSYLEHLEVRTNHPAAPPPDAAFELFKAALWDTTRRRGQIADRDLRVVDMLLAAGWDLVVTRNMLLLAAALRSRVAIEVLSTEPTRANSAAAASKVPSLQVLCRKTGRRQLGKLSL